MPDSIKKKILRNRELAVLSFFTLAVLILLCLGNQSLVEKYTKAGINSIVLGIFGSMLGLLLTAYAILFGLIPALSKEVLETETFDSINKLFVLDIIISIIVIFLGLGVSFIDGNLELIFIILQLTLAVFSIGLASILVLALRAVFDIVKWENSREKKLSPVRNNSP